MDMNRNLSNPGDPATDEASIKLEVITDHGRLSASRAQWARFDRNLAWFQERAADVYSAYRGKFISIAGNELFVGDTAPEAVARARAAHPDDDGLFVRYIPREKAARVYAD